MAPPHAWYGRGSALRMLFERAVRAEEEGRSFSTVVSLPHRCNAAWEPLTRHLGVVGVVSGDSRSPEEYSKGRWRPISSSESHTLWRYPRVAGSKALPVASLETPRANRGE